MKSVIGAAIALALLSWSAGVFAWRYFAAVHQEQVVRGRQMDRREASLNVWSAELEQLDAAGVLRAVRKADAVLERALGPAPLNPDEVPS